MLPDTNSSTFIEVNGDCIVLDYSIKNMIHYEEFNRYWHKNAKNSSDDIYLINQLVYQPNNFWFI